MNDPTGDDPIKRSSQAGDSYPIDPHALTELVDEYAALATMDGGGFFLSANPRFCGLTGYTESELIGSHYSRVQCKLQSKLFWSEQWASIRYGETWRGEICNQKKNGVQFWVSALIMPLRNEEGKFDKFATIQTEITQHKEAEEQLARTTHLLEQTSRVAQVGGWEVDFVKNKLTWSSVTKAIHEVPDDYVPDLQTAVEFYQEGKDRFHVKRLISEAIHKGKPFEFEHLIVTAKGNEVWVRSRGEAVQENGQTVRLIGTFQNIDKELRDKATLQANYAWLESTVSAATRTSIIATDTSGLITVFNRGAEMLLEYDAEDIVGIATPDLFHSETEINNRAKTLSKRLGRSVDGFEAFTIIAQTQGSEEREWTYITKSGRYIPVNLVVTPIRENDVITGYLGIATDLSDVKAAEQRSLENELRFRGAFESAGIGSAIVGIDGTWLEMNERLCSILGYSESELLKLTFQEITHPEDLAADMHLVKETLGGQRSHYQMKKRYFRSDGRVIWVHLSVSLVRSPDGKPAFFIKHIDDISERVQLEKKLMAATERLSLAMQVGGIGIWDWDIAKDCMQWDDQMHALYGLSPDETDNLLDTWGSLIHPDDRDKTLVALQRALSGDEEFDLAFRICRRGGETRTLRAVARIKRDDSDEPIRMIGTNWDISELNSQREQLAKLAEEAKQANDAKTEFLANMSHEIRTPMNGIIGMTRMLLDSKGLDKQQRKYAEIVKSSAGSLLSLINDILDFSKIESGMLSLEELDFNLRETLDDFVSLMRYRASEKGLYLNCEVSSKVQNSLIGDSGRLRQILLNLTGNAIKFTSKGGIRIRVELEKSIKDYAYVRFAVEDSGIGIPEDKLHVLFEKFTQADTSTSRIYGGTGLGLAISRQLSELMGGRIGVESKQGEGSTFWFTVRFALQNHGKHVESNGAHVIGNYVLVVDDDPEERIAISDYLETWSCTTSLCEDGPSALQALYSAQDSNDPYQCAVIDMSMSGMDGISLARVIRQDKRFRNLRIVLMTEMGEQTDLGEAYEGIYNAICTKPIRQSDLFNAIARSNDPTRVDAATKVELQIKKFESHNYRILLAEDNAVNQMVACGILDKLGLSVDVVANGAEAIDAVKNLPYDLVLMDVQMPQMDGLQATQNLKQMWKSDNASEIPIVAMTAHARPEDRAECLEAGMIDYVSKPVSPDALAAVLYRWLPDFKTDDVPEPADEPKPEDLAEPETKSVVEDQPEPEPELEDNTAPASPPPQDEPLSQVLDFDNLLARVMGDEEIAFGVLTMSAKDLRPNYENLLKALETGDRTNALLHIHSIKGSARNAGMLRLADLAEPIERRLKDGDPQDQSSQLEQLGFVTDQTLEEIQRKLAEVEDRN